MNTTTSDKMLRLSNTQAINALCRLARLIRRHEHDYTAYSMTGRLDKRDRSYRILKKARAAQKWLRCLV